MKKICLPLAIAFTILVSCSNNSTHTGESGPQVTNLENVNGNVPDTSTGSTLNSKPAQDSSHLRDSTK